jgi:hypothetical protein
MNYYPASLKRVRARIVPNAAKSGARITARGHGPRWKKQHNEQTFFVMKVWTYLGRSLFTDRSDAVTVFAPPGVPISMEISR